MILPMETLQVLADCIKLQAKGKTIHLCIATDGGATNHKPANTFNGYAGWGSCLLQERYPKR